ncbi:ASCH domain-containing protein [Nocardioides sp. zg-DK7169]|uniref:ASCH domain-containing protein n=1 Tax=Nocardioides sp. zg-DK7169 TaxID=2736600 RepID=UPI001556855E|nr:ASCH domain-containing protein [Nocardioides sp. zg-DK7169]NPC96311.1 ASCH domain-containing protein [Nocardioides sp. zg-DK7169]
MDAVENFWQVARSHARLQPLPGYFPATPVGAVPPPTWSFGEDPAQADAGLRALIDGTLTTLEVSLADLEAAGVPVPEVGTLGIVLDGSGHPRALVVTERVEVGPVEAVEHLRVLHSQ